MFSFPGRQQLCHLCECETHANRALTAQIWDYLRYPGNSAVHKDPLPYYRMTSKSALLLLHHLMAVGTSQICLHDDISGTHVSLLILAPEQVIHN